jgi:hypothetical protein
MLNKNRALYDALISRLPLSDLTALYERSKEYPAICRALEAELDQRITSNAESYLPASKPQQRVNSELATAA